MPLEPLHIDPNVVARSVLLADRRCADPRGHFEILLPSRYRASDVAPVLPSQADSPAPVALFTSVDAPFAELEIKGLFLRREVAPADVLRALCTRYRTLEQRRVPSPGGDLLDLQTRSLEVEPAYLSRWWTVKDGDANGGRLYLLEARAAPSDYPAVAAELATMLASFRLLHPTKWDYFEKLTSLRQTAPRDVLAFYPESWALEVARDGSDGPMIAHLRQTLAGVPIGRITVLVMAGEHEPAAMQAAYRETLGGEVEWLETEPSEPFASLERAWTSRGRVSGPESALELTAFLGRRPDATVLLGLAGLSASADPLAAATLRRALEIVRDTLRIA